MGRFREYFEATFSTLGFFIKKIIKEREKEKKEKSCVHSFWSLRSRAGVHSE